MNEELNCFGKIQNKGKCKRCIYQDSCRYYGTTQEITNKRLADVSIDRANGALLAMADYKQIPGNETTERKTIVEALAEFFKYLLELDEYALGIITYIISPKSSTGKIPNVEELSKIHGCSRQAMHRKLLALMGEYPELSGLFQLTMTKVNNGRQLFRRHFNGV